MSTRRPDIKQFKAGTNGQIIMTTGGVVAWGNPLATTSAVGEVQLATQSQAFGGTPDTSSGNPLVIQPSGTIIRRDNTSGIGSIFMMGTDNQNALTIATANARGVVSLDLQTLITSPTQVASGNRSVQIGQLNTTSGYFSQTIGYSNSNTGARSAVVGFQNSISVASAGQNFNHIFGSYNAVGTNTSARSTFTAGNSNTIAGGASIVTIGNSNNINTASGYVTVIGENNTSGVSAFRAGIFGFNNSGVGSGSFIVGEGNVGNDNGGMSIIGLGNLAQAGAQNATMQGYGNAIQTINNAAANDIAIGIQNVLNSVQNSVAVGLGNNLQGTSGQQDLMAFGVGNTINPPTNGFGVCGAFGQGNTIGTGSARSWAFGENNSVTSLSYGNGAGIAAAFGISNIISNGELVYLFGHGNQSRATYNNVFADYVTACGISNVFLPTSHGSQALGISNVIGGGSSTGVGRGNSTGTGNFVQALGFGNSLGVASATNVTLVGNNNTAGGFGNYSGDNTVFVGNNNHSFSNSNIFGQGNLQTDHTFGSANGYSVNVFGTNNGSGNQVFNSDIFGTGNFVGSSNTGFGTNASNCISIGRGNFTTQNNTIQIGTSNDIHGIPDPTNATHNIFIGNSNVITCGSPTGSSYGLVIGQQNIWGGVASFALAMGYKNRITYGNYTANLAQAIGYQNFAGGSNTVAIGIGNFAGRFGGFGTPTLSSVAIGVLNNNLRSQVFIDDVTGAITFGGFFPNTPVVAGIIGTNSVALGSENITLGLNAIAIGRHNDSSGTQSLAVGYHCNAAADQATAVGNTATARVPQTFNIGGLPIIRKDNGEAVGTEFISYSGMPCIVQSNNVDLKVAQIYSIQLPVGPRFYIDEVGIEVTREDAQFGLQILSEPFVSWGTSILYPLSLVGQTLRMTSGPSATEQAAIQTWDPSTGEITFSPQFTQINLGDTFIILGNQGTFVVDTNVISNSHFFSSGLIPTRTYTQKYRFIAQMSGLAGTPGNREVFSTFENDFGETSDTVAGGHTDYLSARIEVGAVTSGFGQYNGRFWWKGRFVEV